MQYELIDIGANLTHASFQTDLTEVLTHAQQVGVRQLVVTGANAHSSREAAALAQQYRGVLYATAGVHPHEAIHFNAETAILIQELAALPEVVALGEMGLDFNRHYSPETVQEAVFTAQLEMALTFDLPIFLHQRDAHERFLAILRQFPTEAFTAVVHCFTGTEAELKTYLDRGYYIGITGWICDERRGLHLRDMVRYIPADRLMLETDAPYLLPRDLKPAPKNRRNEPAYLPHILRAVAHWLHKPIAQVAAETTQTARTFFRLPAIHSN